MPGRLENLNTCKSEKLTERHKLAVSWKSSSLSLGNPTMTSLVIEAPGSTDLICLIDAIYCSDV